MKKVWINILLLIAVIWIGIFLCLKIARQFTLSAYFFDVSVLSIVFIILGVIDSVRILKKNYPTVKFVLKLKLMRRKMNTFEMWDTSNVIRTFYGGAIQRVISGVGTDIRVIYRGKEFCQYDIDVTASTILLISGDQSSEQYGFVKEEPEISKCFRKGKYGKFGYIPPGNYYKEIDMNEAEDTYYVDYMAVYHGIKCTPDFIPDTDEINLTADPGPKRKLDLDHEYMLKLGFRPVRLGDHQWEDREGYFKSGIKYTDAKLRIYRRKIYAAGREPQEEYEIMRVRH